MSIFFINQKKKFYSSNTRGSTRPDASSETRLVFYFGKRSPSWYKTRFRNERKSWHFDRGLFGLLHQSYSQNPGLKLKFFIWFNFYFKAAHTFLNSDYFKKCDVKWSIFHDDDAFVNYPKFESIIDHDSKPKVGSDLIPDPALYCMWNGIKPQIPMRFSKYKGESSQFFGKTIMLFFSFIIGLSFWILVSTILQRTMCWCAGWHFKETADCCRIKETIEFWSWRRALHWYIQADCKCNEHSTSSIHLRTF